MAAYAEQHDVRGLVEELAQSILLNLPRDPRAFLAAELTRHRLPPTDDRENAGALPRNVFVLRLHASVNGGGQGGGKSVSVRRVLSRSPRGNMARLQAEQDVAEHVRALLWGNGDGTEIAREMRAQATPAQGLTERDAGLKDEDGSSAEVVHLQGELAAAQAELQRKDAALKEMDAELKRRDEAELTQAQAPSAQELTERDAGLKNEDGSESEDSSEEEDSRTEMVRLQGELAAARAELQRKDAALKRRDAALKKKDAALKRKDAALKEKNEDSSEEEDRRTEVVRLQGELAAARGELQRKDAALKKKDAEARALAAALAQRLDPAELARAQEEAQRAAAEEARATAAGELPARWHDPAAFTHAIPELQGQKDFAMLAAGLSFHLARVDAVEAALQALQALLDGPANRGDRPYAFRAGAVTATLAAMDKHGSEREVMLQACKVLWRITSRSPEEAAICTDVGERGGIAALNAALDAFDSDPAIVRAVLRALANVMADNPANMAAVITASGIERFAELLQRFPDDAGLQEWAVSALFNLSFAGPAAQERLKALGVETPVRAAMERPDATADTKKWGQKLLNKLPKVASDEAREAAARALAEQGNTRALLQLLREQAKKEQGGRRWYGGKDEAPPPQAAAAAPAPQAPATCSPGDPEDKFVAMKLILGASEVAAGGLDKATGLTDEYKAACLRDPLASIEMELLLHGSKKDCENFYYILDGTAQTWDDYPAQVQEDIRSGTYHGGSLGPDDYDAGHAGMKLEDFVNHPTSKLAGLKPHHVVVLRLYTSSSFRKFNGPLRWGESPHPWKFALYALTEALKMLRVVDARLHPADFNQVKLLYRGMQNMEVDAEKIKTLGGTELAPMSTTDERSVALAYANSRCPLVFVFKTMGLSRGVCIQYLSLYPKEVEYLYPPLTFLTAEGSGTYQEDGVTFLEVTPQMS